MWKSVTNEKKIGALVDSEKGRYYNASLLESPNEEDGFSHFVTKSQDGDEVGRAPTPGQELPKSFTIDGVEGLGQVNKGHDGLVSFPTFLLNLSGHKYHIGGSSRWSNATLSFREYLFSHQAQAIQENSGQYLPSNG